MIEAGWHSGPACAGATLWFDAWLRLMLPADDLLAALHRLAPDTAPVVRANGASAEPLGDLLAELRASRADQVWLVLPRPGRTLGWPRDAARSPEPAVLFTSGGEAVRLMTVDRSGWRVDVVTEAPVRQLEAEAVTARAGVRRLADLLGSAADRMEALGLDRPSADPLPHSWTRAFQPLPAGTAPELAGLLHRVATVLDALAGAGRDDGAAVTSGEARARRCMLVEVAGQLDDLLVALVAGLPVATRSTPGPSVPSRAR